MSDTTRVKELNPKEAAYKKVAEWEEFNKIR